jgi:adapter protein MecA 1/2
MNRKLHRAGVYMEFKKIDETKFQCLLYEEDLEDNNISLDDFFRNDTAKIHGLLDVVMEEAQKSIGVMMDGGVMSLQLAPQPNHSILLTISSSQQELGKMIKQAGEEAVDVLSATFPQKSNIIKKEQDTGVKATPLQPVRTNEDGLAALKKAVNQSGKGEVAVFRIQNLQELEEFCKNAPKTYGVSNALYKDTEHGCMLLVLKKGRCSEGRYSMLIDMLTEYGELISVEKERIAYIKEHCDVYIKSNAINIMIKYCS